MSSTSEPSALTERSIGLDIGLAVGATVLPLALLLGSNGGAIADRALVLQTGGLAALVATVLVLCLRRVRRLAEPGLVAAALGYTFFFNAFLEPGPYAARTALWLIMAGIAFVLLRVLVGESVVLQWGLVAVLGITVVVTSALGLQASNNPAPEALAFQSIDAERTPNVYVFVMDGLARPDILDEQFPSVDHAEPLGRLAAIGFETSEVSTANYSRTHISVPSMLMGSYQSTVDAPLTEEEEWAYAAQTLSGNNVFVSMLAELGYAYWHAESGIWGHTPCDLDHADRCLQHDASEDPETISALWSMTPFGDNPFSPPEPQDPTTIVDSILQARAAPGASSRPVVVFSHMVSPHNPYHFDAACNEIEVGSLIEGWQIEYMGHYADETNCVLRQLADSMERLVDADPDALVLIVSDHGPEFGVRWAAGGWSDTEVRNRFTNFRSARLPEVCRTDDVRAHSLVNLTRLVSWCLSGEEPEWLELEHFTQTHQAGEVTPVPAEQRRLLYPE